MPFQPAVGLERGWVFLWGIGLVEELGFPPPHQTSSAYQPITKSHASLQRLMEAACPGLSTKFWTWRICFTGAAEPVWRELPGHAVPGCLYVQVALGRLQAFNWLISPDENWDDVNTDT